MAAVYMLVAAAISLFSFVLTDHHDNTTLISFYGILLVSTNILLTAAVPVDVSLDKPLVDNISTIVGKDGWANLKQQWGTAKTLTMNF